MSGIETFRFETFDTGLDTTSARGKAPAGSSQVLINLRPLYDGRLTLVNDHATKVSLNGRFGATWPIVDTGVRRFTRYILNTTSTGNLRYLIFTNRPGTIAGPPVTYFYGIALYNEGSGATLDLSASYSLVTTSRFNDDVTPYYILDDVKFATFGKILIFAFPGIGLVNWYGRTTGGAPYLYYNGIGTPYLNATIVVTGTAGNVNVPGTAPIQYIEYKYTFVNADGVEGNPSPASAKVVPSNKQVTITVTSTVTVESGGVSSNGKAVACNIYRRGADITDNWYRVGTLDITGGLPATFTDNLADIDVSTIQISNNRFVAPAYLDMVLYHNRRLFAASSYGYTPIAGGPTALTTRLYFSGLDAPEWWGQLLDNDIEGQYGGFLDLPGLADDSILTLATTGNILIIGRKNSVYAFYGNSYNNFSISLRANIGVINRRCMCSGHNRVFFWGSNRRIYEVTDTSIEWVSKAIQKDLDALQMITGGDDDIQNAYMRYFDGQIYLFLSNFTTSANPLAAVYVLDLTTMGWRQETDLQCYDALVTSSFSTSIGQTFGTAHTVASEEMLFTNAFTLKLAYAQAIGNAGKLAKYVTQDVALLGPAGFSDIRASRIQMEGVYTEGSSVADPNLPTALLRKSGIDEKYVLTQANEKDTGYSALTQLIFDLRPLYLTDRSIAMGITGKFKALEIQRARMAINQEREVRFE